MSVPRLLIVSAVPFNLSRLQSNFSQNIVKKTVLKSSTDNNESTNQQNLKNLDVKQNSSNGVSNIRLMKKKSRMIKNRIASQVSREKARLRKDLLEKQLLELQVEQMKIRLINSELEIRQTRLEEENALLKKRLGDLTISPQSLNEECATDTLRHAEEVGSVTSVLCPNSCTGGVCEQVSNTESSGLSYLESSPYCDEGYKTDDACSSPSIVEDMLHEESIGDKNEFDSFDEIDNFDEIEKIIFGETNFDLFAMECDSTMEKETFPSECDSFYSAEIPKSKIEGEMLMYEKKSISLPPQWTFENLFDDLEDNCSDAYELTM